LAQISKIDEEDMKKMRFFDKRKDKIKNNIACKG